jgi:hypothetical protein
VRARSFAIAAALIGAFAASAAVAEDKPVWVVTAVAENDLFARNNTDRHYSNGLRATLLFKESEFHDTLWEAARKLPIFSDGKAWRVGLAIGHNIYTPEDKQRLDPIPGDRPYAGWLYGGAVLQSRSETSLETLELDLGVVGPAAFGKEVQNNWHRYVVSAPEVRGWSNQLRNEPGILLVYERRWSAWQTPVSEPTLRSVLGKGLGIDVVGNLSGSVGNVLTYAGAGATLRFGDNLSVDFGPPRIQPALTGSDAFHPVDAFAWYVFVGAEGRAVARNIFLDGNTFKDSQSVSKKSFVADLQGGLVFVFDRFRISYTQAMRTREFDGQKRPDWFGSLGASIRF